MTTVKQPVGGANTYMTVHFVVIDVGNRLLFDGAAVSRRDPSKRMQIPVQPGEASHEQLRCFVFGDTYAIPGTTASGAAWPKLHVVPTVTDSNGRPALTQTVLSCMLPYDSFQQGSEMPIFVKKQGIAL